MSGKNVNFGDKTIKKSDFYKKTEEIKIDDIDVNKILDSKEEPQGTKNSFKYFNGCNDNGVIIPLYIKLPQMFGYAKKVDSNTTMSFKINDKQLLKKYKEIWKKIKSLLNIEFDAETLYDDNDTYIKTKIKKYDGRVNTNFGGKMSKEKAAYRCLPGIMLDSVIKIKKKYYPQTLLQEYIYEIRKIKMKNLIDDNLEKSSSDESGSKSGSESDDETESDNEKHIDESNELNLLNY